MSGFRGIGFKLWAACLAMGFAAAPLGAAVALAKEPQLRFLGEVDFPTGHSFQGTQVGGLSGIDYDAQHNVFYTISDDRSQLNPARFYQLTIDLFDGSLDNGDVVFRKTTTILDKSGVPFAALALDPESIRFDPSRNTLFWTSEGDANALVPPFVRQMTLDGAFVQELNTPQKYFPTASNVRGIRNNLAFESLTIPDRNHVVVATENALNQDGPAATTGSGTPARILQFDARNGQPGSEYIYVTDPVAEAPDPAGGFFTNGLVELLALDKKHFLALERSFSTGPGYTIKIFLADLSNATNVKRLDSIASSKVKFVKKKLLLDLDTLGITLDNIEGITFGPRLRTGEPTLILVSDNNFAATQFTQFLAFAVKRIPGVK